MRIERRKRKDIGHQHIPPAIPWAIVWEPPAPEGQTRDFICFEPMTGITSAVNLQHEGKYAALQTVAPGAKWTESFWVRSSGI